MKKNKKGLIITILIIIAIAVGVFLFVKNKKQTSEDTSDVSNGSVASKEIASNANSKPGIRRPPKPNERRAPKPNERRGGGR